MKRKVYVKQMKMLKEKSKSQEKEEEQQKDNVSLKSDQSSSQASATVTVSYSKKDSSSTIKEETTAHTISSLPSLAVGPSSSSMWSANSNSGPLPTVDVLMKSSSTLRAFQIRPQQPQLQHQKDERLPPSRHTNDIRINSSVSTVVKGEEPYSSSMTSSYSPNSREYHDNVSNVAKWVKDCSNVEHISNVSPKLAHPSYLVEYPGSYSIITNNKIDQSDRRPSDHNSDLHSPPSPVFHQLQVSRLNDNAIKGAVEKSDYQTEHNSTPAAVGQHIPQNGQYGVRSASGSESLTTLQHPHSVHDISRYNHDSSHRNNNNNNTSNSNQIIEDQLQQGLHEQIRTWEQENYRYVDFTWRHGEHSMDDQESGYSESVENEDINHDADNYSNNSNGHDESVDLSNKPTTRSGPRTGGGRRRRKRVQTPVQRSAANMRERRRMCHLNVAFDYLKEHLPNIKDKKKLSRIQTLKAAIYYIHLLQDNLNVQ